MHRLWISVHLRGTCSDMFRHIFTHSILLPTNVITYTLTHALHC
jgi:hypothetical protein